MGKGPLPADAPSDPGWGNRPWGMIGTRGGRAAPKRGWSRPATAKAQSRPAPVAAKIPGNGATSSTNHAQPGVKIPETSRKLEYTALISVRSEGLTAIKKGKPPTTSSSTRKTDAPIQATTVSHGRGDTTAAATNSAPQSPKASRTARRTDVRRAWRSINGEANNSALDTESAMPPTLSPSPASMQKIGRYTT